MRLARTLGFADVTRLLLALVAVLHSFAVRRARIDDAPAVHALLVDAYVDDAPPTEAALRRLIGARGARWLVAIRRMDVVGVIGRRLEPRPTYGLPRRHHISVLAVAARCRRRGLGTALMRAVLDELDAAGADHSTLFVRPENAPARRLYESLGYAQHCVVPNYYRRALTQRAEAREVVERVEETPRAAAAAAATGAEARLEPALLLVRARRFRRSLPL